MTLTKMVADLVTSHLRSDARRVVLGEDVADGGMLGLSRGLVEDESLRDRAWSTPLAAEGFWAHAVGVARGGRRPLVLPASASDVVAGASVLRETLRGGAPGLLIVTVTGPGFGLGGEWSAAAESELARIDGLRVLVAGDPADACGLVAQVADEDQPTVVLIPRSIALLDGEEGQRSESLGARVLLPGDAATVFAWGGALIRATQAVAASEHDVGLVDVRSIAPLDHETLIGAARRTGKIVIAHPGPPGNGVAAELAARFADAAILSLDAPIVRVGGDSGGAAPDSGLPSADAIADAIDYVATY